MAAYRPRTGVGGGTNQYGYSGAPNRGSPSWIQNHPYGPIAQSQLGGRTTPGLAGAPHTGPASFGLPVIPQPVPQSLPPVRGFSAPQGFGPGNGQGEPGYLDQGFLAPPGLSRMDTPPPGLMRPFSPFGNSFFGNMSQAQFAPPGRFLPRRVGGAQAGNRTDRKRRRDSLFDLVSR